MQIESLEPRLLLTSVTWQNDLVTVEGSHARDRIRLTFWALGTGNSIDVLINGHSQPIIGFPPNGLFLFPQFMIRAGAGDDSIKVWMPNGGFVTVHGGSGKDDINVDTRGAKIFGDAGDDRIIDRNTLDDGESIFGGDGHDLIIGSDLNSNLHGGNGNDTLIGGKGDDQLFGDAGNDALKGGDGIDTFFGGDGNDRIYSADSNANEPVDAGEGMDRAFFPDDCSLPLDDFPDIESLRVLGANRSWMGCGCC
jgi:Ca2+-binding RTX toxin-like protein